MLAFKLSMLWIFDGAFWNVKSFQVLSSIVFGQTI